VLRSLQDRFSSALIFFNCKLTDHSLETVGQQHDKARLTHPLGLSRGDELIDDALGSVVEVSKLSLPADQGVGVGHGVTQLESCEAIQLNACFCFHE
jgi:hypothetical protein